MSLYKLGISDKTMGAMQNADPEVQKMILESQQNNNQPDSKGGILSIIKELFGYGDAGASDLGSIAGNDMIQAILNPKTPRSEMTFLESMNRGPIEKDQPYPPEFFPNDQQDSLSVDTGATGIIPLLKNDEEDLTGLFAEGMTTGIPSFGATQKAPTAFGTRTIGGGIGDLFRTLIGFAVPGANLFTGGLDGIRSLNQRLQGSTFGRSRSMQEFLERKRNEKLGNIGSGGIGLSRSELVQRNFADRVRDLADAGDDDTGGGGGASRTQRDAGPGFDDVSEAGSF